MSADNNESAFPSGEGQFAEDGMTLRDYFAAKAMQGWVTAGAFNQEAEDMLKKGGVNMRKPGELELFLAEISYSQADAMIEARKK